MLNIWNFLGQKRFAIKWLYAIGLKPSSISLKTEGFEISCFQEKKSLIQFFLIFKTFKFYTLSNNLNVVFDSMLEMNENEFIYEKLCLKISFITTKIFFFSAL